MGWKYKINTDVNSGTAHKRLKFADCQHPIGGRDRWYTSPSDWHVYVCAEHRDSNYSVRHVWLYRVSPRESKLTWTGTTVVISNRRRSWAYLNGNSRENWRLVLPLSCNSHATQGNIMNNAIISCSCNNSLNGHRMS